jgi:hypothetical protein
MANEEQLQRLLASVAENNGCAAWNQWRGEDWAGFDSGYRTAIDLNGASLAGADLGMANLIRAKLCEADLRGADLQQADLSGANLTGAHLFEVHLVGAILSGADLSGADLRGAILDEANLSEAVFQDAILTDMTGYPLFLPASPPEWPSIDMSLMTHLQGEAEHVTTSATDLRDLAGRWPGYLVWKSFTQNPNLPDEVLVKLGRCYPAAFLSNPAIPLYLLQDPNWLAPKTAAQLLYWWSRDPGEHSWEMLYPVMFLFIRQRASHNLPENHWR